MTVHYNGKKLKKLENVGTVINYHDIFVTLALGWKWPTSALVYNTAVF
jgi:hypothetical protein